MGDRGYIFAIYLMLRTAKMHEVTHYLLVIMIMIPLN